MAIRSTSTRAVATFLPVKSLNLLPADSSVMFHSKTMPLGAMAGKRIYDPQNQTRPRFAIVGWISFPACYDGNTRPWLTACSSGTKLKVRAAVECFRHDSLPGAVGRMAEGVKCLTPHIIGRFVLR